MSDNDEFLAVYWQTGIENVHRSMLTELRRPTDDEARLMKEAKYSPLKSLEALESLDNVQLLLTERERTIRSQREKRKLDDLIRRIFAEPRECNWDRNNADGLTLLALQPDEVGWLFKLREWIHRPIHSLFHHK
jgi:hypothetical protein